MTNDPTPDPAEQPTPAWPPDFTDLTEGWGYDFAEITDGWMGGLIRRRPDGRVDLGFPNLTTEQARAIWRAARDTGALYEVPENFVPKVHVHPYVERLFRHYIRVWHTERRWATHEECAHAADGINEAASRKRLQRSRDTWERLSSLWKWGLQQQEVGQKQEDLSQ